MVRRITTEILRVKGFRYMEHVTFPFLLPGPLLSKGSDAIKEEGSCKV